MSTLDAVLEPIADLPLDAEVLLRVRLAVLRDERALYDRTRELTRPGGPTTLAAAVEADRLTSDELTTLRELDDLHTDRLDLTWSATA